MVFNIAMKTLDIHLTMASRYTRTISFLLILFFKCAFFYKMNFGYDKFEINDSLIADIIRIRPLQKLVFITDHPEIPANFLRALSQKTSVYMTNPRRNITMFHNDVFMLIHEDNLYVTFWDSRDDWYQKMSEIVSMKFWRPRNRMLFLTRNPSDEMITKFGDRACRKYFAPNLAFLHLDSGTIIKYNPFSRRLVRTKDPTVIFEDISKDLHGFQIRLSIFSYFLSEWDGENYVGRDAVVADAVVKHLNASVKYIQPTKNNTRCEAARDMIGVPHREQTCQLIDGSAHLTFNIRILLYYYIQYVDFSVVVEKDDFIMVIPYEESRIRNLISIIPWSMWIVSFIFFVCSSLYMKIYDGLSWAELLLLNVQLLTGHSWSYKRAIPGKIVLLSVIFYCFCLDNLYVSKLASVLTVSNMPSKLTTSEEVAKKPYAFFVETTFEENIEVFKDQSVGGLTEISKKTTALSAEGYLQLFSQCKTDKVYFNTERIAVHYIKHFGRRAQQNCYYILPEYVNSAFMGYFYPRGSPLMHSVDRIVQAIVESGLARYLSYSNSSYGPKQRPPQQEMTKIGMVNILSSFYMLAFGLTTSIIVFLLEFRHEIIHKKYIFDYLY
ncbi:uncharacterized protein LOC143199793 [Rhynchophorus ferrugineus]|uniref:uncharacterized protein LOC143199793 n=1 Tax=Rhynchophorus ferrugineus TaxID=354439 RepID=UPI003FCE8523